MTQANDKKSFPSGRYAHGGGVDVAAAQTGLPVERILDFSASINPLGAPEAVLEAAETSLARVAHYPEVDAASLECALADYHGLAATQVMAGNGSTELIYLLPRALRPRRAVLVAPCFSEYERALLQAKIPFDFFTLSGRDGFALRPAELIAALPADADMIWLANPGNPTGATIAPNRLRELACALPEHTTLVVDEAFIDFVPDRTCAGLVGELSNLIILRSMTKIYGIPGLRLGYLLGAPATVGEVKQMRLPWSLSAPALAAGRACLEASAFRRRTLESISAWRDGLAAGLKRLGLDVYDSSANYLLVRLPRGGSAAAVAAKLRQRGLLIRDCGNFEGLDVRHFRVAVRSVEENARLLRELQEVLPS